MKEILEVCPQPKRSLKCAQRKKLSPKKNGPQKPANKFSKVCPNQKWARKNPKGVTLMLPP
jgi:hypothetical protein